MGKVGLALLLLAWSGSPAGAQSADLPEPLRQLGVLRLEETSEALVATPRLAPDPLGGWLYWDWQSQDARLYSERGDLRAVIGGPGQGPGEFQGPVGLVRLGDRRLVALDGRGRVSVWSSEGDSLLADFASGIPRPLGLVAVRDAEVIVYAMPRITDPSDLSADILYRLHVDDPNSAGPIFTTTLSEATVTAAGSTESPPPVLHGDSVSFALAPYDSIWTVSATPPYGSRSFHVASAVLERSPDPVNASAGRTAYIEWVESSRFVGRFDRTPQGRWVMATWGIDANGPSHSGIIEFEASGRPLWEVDGTWVLLAVGPDDGALYLWDRNGLDPGVIVIAAGPNGQ